MKTPAGGAVSPRHGGCAGRCSHPPPACHYILCVCLLTIPAYCSCTYHHVPPTFPRVRRLFARTVAGRVYRSNVARRQAWTSAFTGLIAFIDYTVVTACLRRTAHTFTPPHTHLPYPLRTIPVHVHLDEYFVRSADVTYWPHHTTWDGCDNTHAHRHHTVPVPCRARDGIVLDHVTV